MAAYRLHRALLHRGVDSTMIVREKLTQDPTVKPFVAGAALSQRVRRRLRRERLRLSWRGYRVTSVTGFSDDRVPFGAEVFRELPPCDVLHVHSMLEFLDFQTFFAEAPGRAPIVRTLHDMNFLTGGCHLDGGCRRHAGRCGACPQLGSRKENDLSRRIWLRKRAALERVPRGRLHVVAPSRWLAAEAQQSGLLRDVPVTVIPLGVDTEVFAPRDRALARAALDLPSSAAVILFSAGRVDNPIKGFAFLAEALQGFDAPANVVLLLAGSRTPPIPPAIRHVPLGGIENQRLLALAYSAADVCVTPSLQDNFPQTALEAMACGTPVVGFAVGGILDMIEPRVNGLLVAPRDALGLRRAIGELLADPAELQAMRGRCRRLAVARYAREIEADRYLALYRRLCGRETPG
jgi:glycosyltransferase involved in cell wall biosynthesis